MASHSSPCASLNPNSSRDTSHIPVDIPCYLTSTKLQQEQGNKEEAKANQRRLHVRPAPSVPAPKPGVPIRGQNCPDAAYIQRCMSRFMELPARTHVLKTSPLKSPASLGQAMEFHKAENDPIRVYGLPKNLLLEYRILSKPATVVRDITVSMADRMDKAKNLAGGSKQTRLVLTGRAGCGKSITLLQTVEHCFNSGWIVLYVPRTVSLMNSSTKHEYNIRTQTYDQSDYMHQTLKRFLTVNKKFLDALQTTKKWSFEKREVQTGTLLSDLVAIAVKEKITAPMVWEATLRELETQTKFPVLMAVDDIQALYCTSKYMDPHFQPIRPYHLTMPRNILEFAAGKRAFSRGAFLSSVCSSETIYRTPLELSLALSLPTTLPVSPLQKVSRNIQEYTSGLEKVEVPDQLTVDEAASLFEVWVKDKAVIPSVADEVFLGKYTESSGNARDFTKGLLRSMEI